MNWLKGRFKFAAQGFIYCLKDKSIRFQMLLGCFVFLCGILFHISLDEWKWILLCISLVIYSEIVNSCIERTIDYISLEKNNKAKKIKDMAAFSVCVICIFSAIVGFIIFIPKLGGLL